MVCILSDYFCNRRDIFVTTAYVQHQCRPTIKRAKMAIWLRHEPYPEIARIGMCGGGSHVKAVERLSTEDDAKQTAMSQILRTDPFTTTRSSILHIV